MTVTCTRAWYATWTKCVCPPCLRRERLVRKLTAVGRRPIARIAEAEAVLRAMKALDWSDAAIASAAGIADDTISGILRAMRSGRPRRITRRVADRIINHGQPTRGYVSGVGVTRKLQALACLGHSLDDISAAGGGPRTTLGKLRRQPRRWVGPGTAAAVDGAWRQLAMNVGGSHQARRTAASHGWLPPLAYDDIDDPTALPQHDVRLNREQTRAEALRLVAAGEDAQDVAEQLGCSVRTVERAVERVDREVA